jgi:hypothetical protein
MIIRAEYKPEFKKFLYVVPCDLVETEADCYHGYSCFKQYNKNGTYRIAFFRKSDALDWIETCRRRKI